MGLHRGASSLQKPLLDVEEEGRRNHKDPTLCSLQKEEENPSPFYSFLSLFADLKNPQKSLLLPHGWEKFFSEIWDVGLPFIWFKTLGAKGPSPTRIPWRLLFFLALAGPLIP